MKVEIWFGSECYKLSEKETLLKHKSINKVYLGNTLSLEEFLSFKRYLEGTYVVCWDTLTNRERKSLLKSLEQAFESVKVIIVTSNINNLHKLSKYGQVKWMKSPFLTWSRKQPYEVFDLLESSGQDPIAIHNKIKKDLRLQTVNWLSKIDKYVRKIDNRILLALLSFVKSGSFST